VEFRVLSRAGFGLQDQTVNVVKSAVGINPAAASAIKGLASRFAIT
jgi:hypothetical protein